MMYCERCKTEVNDPIWIKDSFVHTEVDDGRDEHFDLPICPVCHREVGEANQCACGRWKSKNEDWCKRCVDLRDEVVMRSINRIRIDTRLELSREATKDLIMSFFE